MFHVLLAFVMVVLAGLFAGSETGVYRLSRLRLRLNIEKRKWSAVLLARVIRDSSGLLLSMLVGTNLAYYVATSAMTRMFLDLVASEHIVVLYATLLTAPLLFIFSELIPKNVFLHRADVLTSFMAPLLYVSHKALTWCGAIPLLRLTANVFARLFGSPVSSRKAITSSQSHQVKAILRDTQEEGLLSSVQAEMMDRIANIPGLQLGAVMIPLNRVQSVSIQSGRTALMDALRRHAFTRLLVWQNVPSNIVGFADIYHVLGSGEDFDDLARFVQPIRNLDVETAVIDAVDVMRREQRKIILVIRRRGKQETPVGIVTMKDLVEELMGELAEW